MEMPTEASNGLPSHSHTEAVQKLLDTASEDVDGAAALATEADSAADDASAAGFEADRLQRCAFNAEMRLASNYLQISSLFPISF